MNKYKYISLLFLLLSFIEMAINPSYDMGKDLVRGAMDELGTRAANPSPEVVEKWLKSIMSGSGNSLNSKEFQMFSKEIGQTISKMMVDSTKGLQQGSKESTAILRNVMKDSSDELGAGIGEASDNFGKHLKNTFKNGSEVDQGLQQSVGLVTRNINRGVQSLIHNNAMKMGAIFVITAGSYFTVQYGIPFAFKMIERAWTRPKLIIESSYKSFYQRWFGGSIQEKTMIFSPDLENKLNEIVQVTSTIHKKIQEGKSNIKYRNLLLYGPPGTGKTLFATELAKRSGLEYAFMSGSSFSKFKDGEGIEALDELFAWANKTSGLLIFIDEAETFLLSRDKMDPQSKAYLLLNNFLNYTGNRSDKFMIVFATNHKEALDSAMYRRIDDLVEMPLPGKAERIRILNLYKDIILMNNKQNDSVFINSVANVLTPKAIEKIAIETKGLSAAELEGIMNNIKTSADILDPAILTMPLVNRIVQDAVIKYFSFTGGKFLGIVED